VKISKALPGLNTAPSLHLTHLAHSTGAVVSATDGRATSPFQAAPAWTTGRVLIAEAASVLKIAREARSAATIVSAEALTAGLIEEEALGTAEGTKADTATQERIKAVRGGTTGVFGTNAGLSLCVKDMVLRTAEIVLTATAPLRAHTLSLRATEIFNAEADPLLL